MKLTIGKQIMLVSILLVLAFTGLNVYTYYQIGVIEDGYDGIIDRSVPLVFDVKDLNMELSNQSAQVRAFILTANPQYQQDYDLSRQRMNKSLVTLEENLRTPEGKQQVSEVKNALAAYHKISDEALVIRQTKGEAEGVKIVATATQEMVNTEKVLASFDKFLDDRMELRKDQNIAAATSLHRTIIILNVIVFILAVGVALYLSRRISRPLAELAGIAHQVADGDLKEQQISYRGQDEIGDLVEAFNTMTANLRDLVIQVAKAAEQVAASSEQLTASAEQSAQAAGQVAETVTGVATGAESQVAGVEQAVAIVNEMSTAVNHIAATAEEVAGKSQETTHAAEAGGQAISQATGQMETINRVVSESAEVVQKLGESSKQIGEIVGVISGIAGQTNLLALNAAIEAARAGEHGRGFSVVADEVRKLAEQSQEAAQKIETIIQTVQSETGTAVSVMHQGTEEVAHGTTVIGTAGERFNKIIELIEHLNGRIQGISAASEQLAASSSEVVNSVDEIKKVAGDTASSTQTISAAAEEQSAAMQEIAASSQSLSTMAQQLQNAVSKFRL